MVNENLRLSIGNRYISGSNRFQDSNLVTFGGYLRLGENWGFSVREAYEFATAPSKASGTKSIVTYRAGSPHSASSSSITAAA